MLCRFRILASPARLPFNLTVTPWRTKMSSGPNSTIGLLVADDSSAICRLIVQLLSSERSIHFVGIASTLEDTLHLAAASPPDVLLLDLHLDDLLPQNPLAVKIGLLSCVRHIVAMSTRCDEQE